MGVGDYLVEMFVIVRYGCVECFCESCFLFGYVYYVVEVLVCIDGDYFFELGERVFEGVYDFVFGCDVFEFLWVDFFRNCDVDE